MIRLTRFPRPASLSTRAATAFAPNNSQLANLSRLRLYSSSTSGDALERAKRAAGFAAVEQCLTRAHKVIGIGSGSTVVAVVDALKEAKLDQVGRIFVPTSFQSRQLIIDAGLQLGSIEDTRHIDLTFDGADDIDLSLSAIKGGGACHLREKVVADLSADFVLVADWRKASDVLGSGEWKAGVPLEVVPFAAEYVLGALETVALSARLRMGGTAKAGPVVTDNGNLVIDAVFPEELMRTPAKLRRAVKGLTGVVEVGLFVEMAKRAFVGMQDGTVKVLTPQPLPESEA